MCLFTNEEVILSANIYLLKLFLNIPYKDKGLSPIFKMETAIRGDW